MLPVTVLADGESLGNQLFTVSVAACHPVAGRKFMGSHSSKSRSFDKPEWPLARLALPFALFLVLAAGVALIIVGLR